MSVRRPLAATPVEFRSLLLSVAAAGLLTACGMPQAPEPEAFVEISEETRPELYGGPVQESEPGEAYAEANPYADDGPPAYEPPVAPEETRRAGWGTMDPIPNPPGTPPSNRAFAAATPQPATPTMAPEDAGPVPAPGESGLPRTEERLGAYALGPVAPPSPSPYADRASPPAYEAAPYAEGAPAASYPPVVVQMQPVPNPPERARATAQAKPVAPPRSDRRETPRRASRADSDTRLLGGPAAVERPSRQAAAADNSARAASATVVQPRRAATEPVRRPAASAGERPSPSTSAPAARKPAASTLPPANTPAGRAARLKQLETTLARLVQQDSTLALPESIEPGRTERITLTLPQALSETLTREARAAGGLRELASRAEVRTDLAGEGWRIEPEEPQIDELRSGRVSSFTWQATPSRGAGPLTADVDLGLQGGGRNETLQLGELTREVESGGTADFSAGGLSWRAIGAALLLLALLIGGLIYARRNDDEGVSDGSRRRFNRRRPDPVNLTPYSPSADTDAPRTDGDPEPARP